MAFTETLKIVIDANTKGFVAATKQASDSTKRMDSNVVGLKQRLGGFAKAAAVGLAGVGVAAVAFGDDLVRAAEESNKVTAQTDAVLKSMGLSAQVSADQIAKLSEKLSLKSGIDDEVIQSGQNVLLTFKSVAATADETGGVFDRASAAALDMSVALGQDMQSSVIQVGKALNDPIRGLTALRRVGIQFTAAQEDQIKAMVEAGDQAGAMGLILDELERQFGGSAEAQATASDKLSVAWGNLQETLGEKLLPVVERFTTWLTNTGIPALESLIGFIEDNKTAFIALTAVVGGVLVAAFTAWAVSMIAAAAPIVAIGAAVGVVAYLVVTHFDTIRNAFMTAFNWVRDNWPLLLGILTGPIGLAVLAITKHWATIRDAAAAVFNWVKANWPLLLAIITGPIGIAVLVIAKHWATIRAGAAAVVSAVAGFFTALPGRIAGALGQIPRLFRTAMSSALQTVVRFAGDIVDAILSIPRRIAGIGGRIASAVRSGLSGALSGVDLTPGFDLPGFGGFLQHGGRAVPGKWYVTGEAGPELFVPDTAGMIVPNHAIGHMGGGGWGGGGTTIVVNASFPNYVGDRSELIRALRDGIRVVGGRGPDSVQRALGVRG